MLLGCLAAVFAQQRPAPAQIDTVFAGSGTGIDGSLSKMDRNSVTFSIAGTERTFNGNEIKKITFGDEPQLMRRARDAALNGRFKDALDTLNQISANQLSTPFIKQDHEFYKVYTKAKLALGGSGALRDAGIEVHSFIRNYPNNYHYYQANELFGDLAAAMNRYDLSEQYYAKVAEAPWPDYKMRAGMLTARALMFQQKFAEAIPHLEKVISDESMKTPEALQQKTLAKVTKAKCLAHTGKAAENVAVVQGVIQQSDPRDTLLFGRAYNALGTCYAKAQKPKQALLAFLHTDILFWQEPETHAEALYHLSTLWRQVNKPDRAVQARSMLTQRYPSSFWGARLSRSGG